MLSDILKEKEKWLDLDTESGSGSWKKKQRTAQFPLPEEHLAEWVDRAKHVSGIPREICTCTYIVQGIFSHSGPEVGA